MGLDEENIVLRFIHEERGEPARFVPHEKITDRFVGRTCLTTDDVQNALAALRDRDWIVGTGEYAIKGSKVGKVAESLDSAEVLLANLEKKRKAAEEAASLAHEESKEDRRVAMESVAVGKEGNRLTKVFGWKAVVLAVLGVFVGILGLIATCRERPLAPSENATPPELLERPE